MNEVLNYYKDLEIYSSHGTLDDIIPISLVENYIVSLANNNNLVFDKFEAGHTISQMNLNLNSLNNKIIKCRACPRLIKFRNRDP